MARLQETVTTRLPLDDAFAFVADFANAPKWDPGTATSEREDEGPVRPGSSYRLGVRIGGKVAPMNSRVVGWEPPRRVVLHGSGSGVEALDDIQFSLADGLTRVDYTATIRLTGWRRILEPFAGGLCDRIARDAASGMHAALEALASERVTA